MKNPFKKSKSGKAQHRRLKGKNRDGKYGHSVATPQALKNAVQTPAYDDKHTTNDDEDHAVEMKVCILFYCFFCDVFVSHWSQFEIL